MRHHTTIQIRFETLEGGNEFWHNVMALFAARDPCHIFAKDHMPNALRAKSYNPKSKKLEFFVF